MEALIHREIEANRGNEEDFNNWILTAKKGKKDQFSEETNQLLMNNLLHMRRHAKMGVKVAKDMRKSITDNEKQEILTKKLKNLTEYEENIKQFCE